MAKTTLRLRVNIGWSADTRNETTVSRRFFFAHTVLFVSGRRSHGQQRPRSNGLRAIGRACAATGDETQEHHGEERRQQHLGPTRGACSQRSTGRGERKAKGPLLRSGVWAREAEAGRRRIQYGAACGVYVAECGRLAVVDVKVAADEQPRGEGDAPHQRGVRQQGQESMERVLRHCGRRRFSPRRNAASTQALSMRLRYAKRIPQVLVQARNSRQVG